MFETPGKETDSFRQQGQIFNWYAFIDRDVTIFLPEYDPDSASIALSARLDPFCSLVRIGLIVVI